MSKIKINLASGNVLEKPLVTCFKGVNGSYLVLDNETNGSMGLPIICISKFNGTAAEKIFDQNEWASVKENLKTIIAGTTLPYLNVPETITAQDDFFTQLTLPVASFDLLKNVYAPAPVAAPVAETTPVASPVAEQVPEVAPVSPSPSPIGTSKVIAPLPVAPATSAPDVAPAPISMPDAPVTAPVIDTPIVSPVSSAPVTPTPVAVPEVQAPVIAAPTIETTTVQASGGEDIVVIKENFMKSCEMMFDALIKKFENK